MKKDAITRVVNGKTHILYPESTKKLAVKEIEVGLLSLKEAMLKYKIHQAHTIQGWMKEYSEIYRNNYMQTYRTDAERRQIVYKIKSGVLSIDQASQHYRVTKRTIERWIPLYYCEPIKDNDMREKNVQPGEMDKSVKALQKEVDFLRLKVEGLETMIDIAEKELKINIRKKAGTKQ